MTYAPGRHAVILHGGGNPEHGLMGDTWSYDGAAWIKLADGGPVRGRHRLVYDGRTNAVLLYGGWGPDRYVSTELWALASKEWKQIR